MNGIPYSKHMKAYNKYALRNLNKLFRKSVSVHTCQGKKNVVAKSQHKQNSISSCTETKA